MLPVLPYAFEMLALRRMTKTAFGTLMALEPAIGVLTGLVVLRQQPSLIQVAGIALVIIAAAAAQRGSQRHPATATTVASGTSARDPDTGSAASGSGPGRRGAGANPDGALCRSRSACSLNHVVD